MTKAELIEKIARSRELPQGISKKEIAALLDITFEELSVYFGKSKATRSNVPRFTFPGFGTFTKKRRSARRGVNPRTLEPLEIQSCWTLDFKPASTLKDTMNVKPTKVSDAAATEATAAGRSAEGADLVLPAAPLLRARRGEAAGTGAAAPLAGAGRGGKRHTSRR
jgi:DNA-binding protein HU-beta